jgi:hypothetical protein
MLVIQCIGSCAIDSRCNLQQQKMVIKDFYSMNMIYIAPLVNVLSGGGFTIDLLVAMLKKMVLMAN